MSFPVDVVCAGWIIENYYVSTASSIRIAWFSYLCYGTAGGWIFFILAQSVRRMPIPHSLESLTRR